jgi:hypothetical protein
MASRLEHSAPSIAVRAAVAALLLVAMLATLPAGLASADPVAPTNSEWPAISPPAPVVGDHAFAGTGKWTGDPTEYEYQWQTCSAGGGSCANISGATNATLTVTSGMLGSTLRVTVSAQNAAGFASATSVATAPVRTEYSDLVMASSPRAYYTMDDPDLSRPGYLLDVDGAAGWTDGYCDWYGSPAEYLCYPAFGAWPMFDSSGNHLHSAYQTPQSNGNIHLRVRGFSGPGTEFLGGQTLIQSNNTHMSSGAPSSFSDLGAFTVEMWIRVPSGETASQTSLFGTGSNLTWYFLPGENNALWNLDGGHLEVRYRNIMSGCQSTGADLRDGEWHHVAVTRDGSTVIPYIDGAAQTALTANGSNVNTTYPMTDTRVGAYGEHPSGIDMTLDEVAVHPSALSAPTIAAHAGAAYDPDPVTADRFRPIFAFDSGEKWRPLNVDRFLDETFEDAQEEARHQLCPDLSSPGDDCTTWGTQDPPTLELDDLAGGADETTWPYIDVHGEGDEPANFVSPRLASCDHGILYDCDHGADSGLYYHASGPYPEAGYRFFDYWAFYRYNKFDGGDHEADWEDVIVAVPDVADPQDFAWVGMSAHGPIYKYFRGTLACGDPDAEAGTCGTEEEHSAEQRVVVYPANGSHANYPDRCSAPLGTASCQRHDGGSGSYLVGEKGHDGDEPWGANDESSTLMPFPGWVRWRGWWGFKDGDSHVKSPGLQAPYDHPGSTICTEWNTDDDLNCPAGRGASADANACAAWNGPGTTAAVCDPVALRQSMAAGTLGVNPGPPVTVAGAVDGTFASSGGVAQVPGDALAAGDALTVTSTLSPAAQLMVRVRDGKATKRLRFAAKDLPNGRNRVRVTRVTAGARKGDFALTRPDGTTVAPVAEEPTP